MIKPVTWRRPSALAARKALTVESRPPDSPRMPLWKPDFASSSRIKAVRIFSTNGALIFIAPDDPFQGFEDELGFIIPLEGVLFTHFPDLLEVDVLEEGQLVQVRGL